MSGGAIENDIFGARYRMWQGYYAVLRSKICGVMIMKEAKTWGRFFLIGGAGYGIIEVIWRGHTHWSMIMAGGICFVIFSEIAGRLRRCPLILKAAIAALGVTAVELLFGVLFNIVFGMGVWDYSDMPYNLFGLICPAFSLAWLGLSLVFLPLAELLNERFG